MFQLSVTVLVASVPIQYTYRRIYFLSVIVLVASVSIQYILRPLYSNSVTVLVASVSIQYIDSTHVPYLLPFGDYVGC